MKKPTIEECRAYAEEQGYEFVDPDRFWHYYESIGWKVGGGKNAKPMVSWKGAMGGWNARDKGRGNNGRRVRIQGHDSPDWRF